jgi:hypothetical protein
MKTFILPGYSEKNKVWVQETSNNLKPLFDTTEIYWPHWSSGQTKDNWIEDEVSRIITSTENQNINVIAKSVGTIVATTLIKTNLHLINKIILCGIPFKDFMVGDEKIYEVLKELPPEKILCIQNENDNHGNFESVKQLILSINPNIKVISKPRADHEYPYFEDFIEFLK